MKFGIFITFIFCDSVNHDNIVVHLARYKSLKYALLATHLKGEFLYIFYTKPSGSSLSPSYLSPHFISILFFFICLPFTFLLFLFFSSPFSSTFFLSLLLFLCFLFLLYMISFQQPSLFLSPLSKVTFCLRSISLYFCSMYIILFPSPRRLL